MLLVIIGTDLNRKIHNKYNYGGSIPLIYNKFKFKSKCCNLISLTDVTVHYTCSTTHAFLSSFIVNLYVDKVLQYY